VVNPEEPSDSTVRYTDRDSETEPSPPPGAVDLAGDEWALPTRIGPYEILSRLGDGGMGDVLLAYDETLLRQIALKRIRPDRLDDADLRQRFEVEARVTARLQHPSVLPVYHYSLHDASAYYTMRPVEGFTLKELVGRLAREGQAREAWPTARIVRLFLQASNAVAYAHSRSVIHRDLKPSNIMIGPFEEVLVLDWGMAKVSGQAPDEPPIELERLHKLKTETESQILVGTPTYMAPELFEGAPASPASDQFSLGLILYELLALRPPWHADTIAGLLRAMRTPPTSPTLLQPGRNIPHALSEIVLRSLSCEAEQRFGSVTEFAQEVAGVLEGRAPWRADRESDQRRHWRVANGRHSLKADILTLRSRGADAMLRYFYTRRLTDNIQIEFEINLRKGNNELAVCLNTALTSDGQLGDGYSLQVVPGRRRTLSLLCSGRAVAGAKSPTYETGDWYRIQVRREENRLSLTVEDREVYVYSDPIPLTGGYIGFTGRSNGLRIRNLRILTKGSSARISCLAVPDALFNRALYQEAQGEYEGIAAAHEGRREGRIAQYRAVLCQLRQSEHEPDPELRLLLLEEALESLHARTEVNDSCLVALARAMIAGAMGQTAEKREALAAALEAYPGDPHLPAVQEWILGKLHSLTPDSRHVLAELLPLAIAHCMSNWGGRVIRERVHSIRSSWETPPFLTGRGKFKESDPVSHAEASMLLAFWAGRHLLITETISELVEDGLLKGHHISDSVFALLELQRVEEAADVLSLTRDPAQADLQSKIGKAWQLCVPAVAAMQGELELALDHFKKLPADKTDRGYNSLRLWLARAAASLDGPALSLKILQRQGARDLFAREQRAWFHLLCRDPERANQELEPFIERGDHRNGRNLSNLLHGVALKVQGLVDSGQRVFSYLDSPDRPRTWTLGSHFLAGRIHPERFLADSLPWERYCLRAQLQLAATALDTAPDPFVDRLSAR